MKITLEISDLLFRRAEQHCSEHGISMRMLIETGLRATLDPPKTAALFRLRSFGFRGEGQVTHDWSAIREMAYEGRGGLETNL